MTKPLIQNSGFIDQQMRLPVADPALQCPESGRVVGEPGRSAGGAAVHVQMVFRDIDADAILHGLRHVLCLS